MTAEPAKALCPECGGPVRAGRCAACGHAEDVSQPPRPSNARADAAWSRAARTTLAFLALQVALRVAVVAMGDGGARTHLVTAAAGAGVILGVYRALTRRNEAVLAVWSWLSAAGALVLAAGAGLWWALGSPGLVRVAVALAAAALTAAYAWVLRNAAAALDGEV